MFDLPDWAHLFAFDTPLLEIFIRGTVMYLGLVFLMRVIMNRQSGSVALTDILLIVLIADAAQNGMADDYHSVTDGLMLVATLMFWDFALDWLAYHSDFFQRLINPKEVMLIRRGKVLHKNLKREMITLDELESHLREKGLENIRQVKTACIESGGEISVVPYERQRRARRAAADNKGTPGAA